jgi:hypothetical protein
MKVALTCATGFIGSHVRADLHKHGHEVTALVRGDTQADTVAARGATPAVAGLYDRPTVSKLLGSADAAIHRAAPATPPARTWTPPWSTRASPDEPPVQVQNHARAFQDMHRELYRMYVEARARAADTFRRLYWDTALSWGDPVLRLLPDVVGISRELSDSERTAVLGVTATKPIPRLAALRPQTQPHAS